jgi:hypothetical protein
MKVDDDRCKLTSVYPKISTRAAVNSTLTIIANALRVRDRLLKRLQ